MTDLEREAWQDDLKRRNQSVRDYRAMLKRHLGDEWEPYFRARLEAKTVARDAVKAEKAKLEGEKSIDDLEEHDTSGTIRCLRSR